MQHALKPADAFASASSPMRILCVHQGHELYGSDRMFVSSLEALRRRYPHASFTVILPRDGELAQTLAAIGFPVTFEKTWVVRKANGVLKTLADLAALPFYLARAARRMKRHTLTYINTSVIFDYALASRLVSGPVVLHVHEIPGGMALRAIRAVITLARAEIVFVSAATKAAFGLSSERRQSVLHNGIPHRFTGQARLPFSGDGGRVRLLMIGRINSWKGQDLLVEAVGALPAAVRQRIDIKFAGAGFGDSAEVVRLTALVRQSGLEGQVQFEGFVAEPSPLYQWADIVAVPSKKPEPFGLVAVEAMAHGRPVIAANHGGLAEIVVHEQSGLLFKPGDPRALADALRLAMSDPARMQAFGQAGQSIYAERFTESRYQENFLRIVSSVLAPAGHADARTRALGAVR